MRVEVFELKRKNEKEWDDYVKKHPESTFFHQIGWRNIISKTYRHKPIYLMAKEKGDVKGVLPLFLIKSKLFGTKLVSIPFAPYGGVCANDSLTEVALIERARELTKLYDADYLELRNTKKIKGEFDTDYQYVTFIINLNQNPKVIWERIKRDKRKNIRNAKKFGLEMDWESNITDFYKIYTKAMRDLGTPVHDFAFFKNILSEFPYHSRVLSVKLDNDIICSRFLLFYRDTIIAMWGFSLNEYKKYNAYSLSNWEVIKYGCGKGYKYFDLGRCIRNSGVYNYKKRWGGFSKQLYYQYYLWNTNHIPNNAQLSSKRQKFANIWKRLPLLITNAIGPKLRKSVP